MQAGVGGSKYPRRLAIEGETRRVGAKSHTSWGSFPSQTPQTHGVLREPQIAEKMTSSHLRAFTREAQTLLDCRHQVGDHQGSRSIPETSDPEEEKFHGRSWMQRLVSPQGGILSASPAAPEALKLSS